MVSWLIFAIICGKFYLIVEVWRDFTGICGNLFSFVDAWWKICEEKLVWMTEVFTHISSFLYVSLWSANRYVFVVKKLLAMFLSIVVWNLRLVCLDEQSLVWLLSIVEWYVWSLWNNVWTVRIFGIWWEFCIFMGPISGYLRSFVEVWWNLLKLYVILWIFM